jgi:hypothetical protein
MRSSPADSPASAAGAAPAQRAVAIDAAVLARPANWRVAALGLAIGTGMLAWATGETGSTAHLNDFFHEAWPAYQALSHWHLLQAVRLAPVYVGSLVLRAPFALLASAFGGGSRAVFFATGLPCVVAEAAFCAWLSAQPRRAGVAGRGNRLGLLLVWFLNPVVIVALVLGHPEEILGAVLCAAGVVLAVQGDDRWSGVLIGLAVANKTWAAVAVPVALVALPAGRRWRGLLLIAATAGAILIPVTAVRVLDAAAGSGGAGAQLGAQVGSLSFPRELLWWFGPHSWIVRESRWALLAVTSCCALLWLARNNRAAPARDAVADAMLMLALVLLLRCALDPWDNLYYNVPFLLALLTYEARLGRMPRLTLLYTVLLIPVLAPDVLSSLSANQRAAAYAAVALPMIAWLSCKLFVAPGEWRRLGAASRSAWARARQATV